MSDIYSSNYNTPNYNIGGYDDNTDYLSNSSSVSYPEYDLDTGYQTEPNFDFDTSQPAFKESDYNLNPYATPSSSSSSSGSSASKSSGANRKGLGGIDWTKLLMGGGSSLLGGIGDLFSGKDAEKAERKRQEDILNFEKQKEATRIREYNETVARNFAGIEGEVRADAVGNFRNLRNNAPSFQALQAIGKGLQEVYRPAVTQAGQMVQNLFGGQGLQERLANAQPVVDATMQQGTAGVRAFDTGLQDTYARIAAQNAARGYTGTSSAQQGQLLRATVGNRAQANQAVAGAHLQGQQLLQGIKEDDYNRRLASVLLPGQLAANQFQFETFPDEQARNMIARDIATRGSVFDSLRAGNINPGNPFGGTSGASIYNQPIVSPGIGNILSGLGQAGSQYLANQQMANAIRERGANNQQGVTTGGYQVPSNTSFDSGQTQFDANTTGYNYFKNPQLVG